MAKCLLDERNSSSCSISCKSILPGADFAGQWEKIKAGGPGCMQISIMDGRFFDQLTSFLYLNFIGLLQCNKKLSVISSMDWERTIPARKPSQYFEFGPASQDPFSFCQMQLALNTVQRPENKGLFLLDFYSALNSAMKEEEHFNKL